MNDVEISKEDARAAYLRMIDGDPRPSHEPLEAAYKARALAAAQFLADKDALAIAEQVEADAAGMAQRAEQGALDKEDESAAALAAQMLAGDKPIEITIDEQVALASAVAQSRVKLASKAATKLREKQAKSLQEFQTAEAAVAAAVDAILDEELIATAKLLEFHLDEAARIGKPLSFEVRGISMATRHPIPEPVSRAVARLDKNLINRDHIPINLLNYGDSAAIERRKVRRAEMISGESAPVADAAA
jgi:hypothetical protein